MSDQTPLDLAKIRERLRDRPAKTTGAVSKRWPTRPNFAPLSNANFRRDCARRRSAAAAFCSWPLLRWRWRGSRLAARSRPNSLFPMSNSRRTLIRRCRSSMPARTFSAVLRPAFWSRAIPGDPPALRAIPIIRPVWARRMCSRRRRSCRSTILIALKRCCTTVSRAPGRISTAI